MGELVTKADLLAIKADLQAIGADRQATKASLQAAMDTLSLRLTLRLGVMLAAGLATLAAIIKL
jgi:hypothetical protein